MHPLIRNHSALPVDPKLPGKIYDIQRLFVRLQMKLPGQFLLIHFQEFQTPVLDYLVIVGFLCFFQRYTFFLISFHWFPF